MPNCDFFSFARCVHKIALYSDVHGRRQKFAGGFRQYAERIKFKARVEFNAPRRKILDFRPSAIVTAAFSEYRARIPRIMQTARLVIEAYIHACKHSSVIKGCVCWSGNRTQFSGLLVRQSRIFRVCGVIAPLFLKSRSVQRNLCTGLCTGSAVPEEATRQGKVPEQESNGVFSVTLGALNPSSLRRISPSPSP